MEPLVVRLREGDAGALDQILDRHWTPLVRYLTRILDHPDAAEDVAQRTFVRLWERRHEWSAEGSLRGLIFRIGRNLAISERRSQGARDRAVDRMDVIRLHPPEPTPAEALAGSELARELEAAIAALPRRRREVFVLRAVQGMSYAEVATVMGISEQTVANQLSRALSTLRETLGHLLDDR